MFLNPGSPNPIKKDYKENQIAEETKIKETYSTLSKYPLPKPPYVTYAETNHIVIMKNLQNLIPNIDYEYLKNRYSTKEIYEWLNNTSQYMNNLQSYMQTICNKELKTLQQYEELNKRTKAFKMEKTDELPDEVLSIIHSYLPYETRVELLLAKYPTIEQMLSKMTMMQLKSFLNNHIYIPYYRMITEKNYSNIEKDRAYARCLPPNFHMRINAKTKTNAINHILSIIHIYHNIDPITHECYTYYQNEALQILLHIVYITRPKIKIKQKPQTRSTKKQNTE